MAVLRKPKAVRLAFRATSEDAAMLNELIEKTGLSSSDVIRMGIRALHAREFGERVLTVAEPRRSRTLTKRRTSKTQPHIAR